MALLKRLRDLPWALLRLGSAGGGRAAGVLAVWLAWDRLVSFFMRARPVRPGGLLLYRVVRRHRRRMVEIHVDNRALLEIQRNGRYTPWRALAVARADLRELARIVESGALGEVDGLRGLTLLAPAGPALGFEVRPLPPTWRWRLVGYYMAGLDAVFNPGGTRRLHRFRSRRPVELWMPGEALRWHASSDGAGRDRRRRRDRVGGGRTADP